MTDNEGHPELVLALIAGGALLLWRLGRGGSGKGAGTGDGAGPDRPSVRVMVRAGDRIELDGITTDLATAVARARASGKAFVHVTGDARQGWFETVVHALEAAGVAISLDAP
jgi:hypothetical protein